MLYVISDILKIAAHLDYYSLVTKTFLVALFLFIYYFFLAGEREKKLKTCAQIE
jgi:hypothetical protein